MPEELRARGRAGNDRFRCGTKFDATGVEPAEDKHEGVRGTGTPARGKQQIRVAG
jgi:hypothetical protein